MSEVSELARLFVDALTKRSGDSLLNLCSGEARHWINVTGQEQTIADLAGFMELEKRLWPDYHCTDTRVLTTRDGFAVQLIASGTLTSGDEMRVSVCVVATVRDGLIERLDEYADGRQLKPLLRLLAVDPR